jgi:hypothetical protein
MDLLGIEHSYPGDDLFQLPADRERDRPVVLVTERASSSPVLHRWRVRGSVIDTTSWHPLEPVIVERRPHAYRWGDKVGFGITGEGERYLTSGWSTTSPTLHWNDGDTAELTFAVEPPPQDVQVRFVFFPYIVPGKVPQQRIRLHINGYDVGGVTCTEKRSLNLDISVEKEVLQDGKMLITFDFLDAVSPASIGAGRDPRRMAMGLYGFETKFIDE